ncbi:hypothetical protein SteCoe_32964 [Stentor coeruleus]|uniref:PPM-type phosphatase domain-containing protein n=1 Tax=Stentor coeruleus TaxID=5963 RepID=A0A1R2AXU6_9CILI|nr:hypothetical protein SteCoe_32964 [Stentor coeruleus]
MEKPSFKPGHFSSHPILKPISKYAKHIQFRRSLIPTIHMPNLSVSPEKSIMANSINSLSHQKLPNISLSTINNQDSINKIHNQSQEKLNSKKLKKHKIILSSSRLLLYPLAQYPQKTISNVSTKSVTGTFQGHKKKLNQDSFLTNSSFQGIINQTFLGVFDGHGVYGGEISKYVKNSLSRHIKNLMTTELKSSNQEFDENSLKKIKGIFIESHKITHNELKKKTEFDSSLSGTTAITVLIRGKQCICSNVGDSRAVIGRYDKDGWKAIALSQDHKPNVPVERERIENAGGIISPFMENNGGFVGPQRVWLRTGLVPGLAMSRSVGDFVAEQVGVSHLPDVTLYELDSSDKFIVLASDGIWEFISNEECVEIISSAMLSGNLTTIIDQLVNTATYRWNKENNSVDDITAIIASFNINDT